MGITSTLYFGYTEKEVETKEIVTPFGQVSVYLHNQKIKFHYTTKKHIFKNGISANIHRIAIDTMQYQLHDEFDVRVGNVDGFEYYDSNEHTVMCEFHDKKYSIAVIGYDSDYDFERDCFIEDAFTFRTDSENYGMNYKIVRDPTSFIKNNIIYTWIVFLPISDAYDAADLIDIELV
jgi:hypothetical protein